MPALAFVPTPNARDSYSEEIMPDSATDRSNGFNDRIIAEFRANGGRVSGSLAGTPLILIHHIGAKSGIERVTPLACNPQDDGRIVIVASNGGSPTHPSWYYNLKANPRIEVEVGTETFTVLAEELDGFPARAVAEIDRGVSFHRRIPGHDDQAGSVVRASPRGLTGARARPHSVRPTDTSRSGTTRPGARYADHIKRDTPHSGSRPSIRTRRGP